MPDSLDNASVDDVLEQIGPGKLIRSEVFKWMIERIRELEEEVSKEPPGQVSVPNLIGRTLGTAIDTLDQASVELRLGRVLSTSGVLINTDDPEQRSRVLLAQFPTPNERVASDSAVEFLAAPLDDSETNRPVIDKENFPSSARVGTLMTIPGSNFPSAWPSDTPNSVTFDGVEAEVQSGSSSPTAITVRIPESIPNAPTGDEELEVTVEVNVEGQSDSTTMTVLPAPEEPLPQITSLPDQAEVGELITIAGENFSETASENTVYFGTDPQNVEASSTTSLDVVVPEVSGLGSQPGSFKSVTVTVEVGEYQSNEKALRVVVPFD